MINAAEIKKLPDHVIRKIAAGEVVERPANAVKELVENSIDSQATEITVEILEGGIKLISVTDNGCGIPANKLPLAVSCHSTSKLTDFSDLASLHTMGFRGEALSAISAVSEFAIRSRTHQASEGCELKVANQSNSMPSHLASAPYTLPYQGPPGTCVICENLFFNVPARQKFLRRPATEFSYILRLIHAMALSHPMIKWSLIHNHKEVFKHIPPPTHCGHDHPPQITDHLSQLTGTVLGITDHNQLITIEAQNLYGTVTGLITPPDIDYATNKRMFTFVNQRWIQDRMLYALISRGYHSHLLKSRYPGCVFMLNCEPSLVDVNIHPAKREIKFQYQSEIAKLIHTTIQTKLRAKTREQPPTIEGASINNSPPNELTTLGKESSRDVQYTPSFSPNEVKISTASASTSHSHQLTSSDHSSLSTQVPPPIQVNTRSSTPSLVPPTTSSQLELNSKIFEQKVIPWARLIYLGTFARLYWIMEDPKEHQLILVDQHAFHECIIFARLKSSANQPLKQHQLLSPTTIKLTPIEVSQLIQHQSELTQFGFEFEHTPTSITLYAVPAILAKTSHQELLAKLAQQTMTSTSPAATPAWLTEDLLSTLACHSAIRTGDIMSDATRTELLREVAEIDVYSHHPHGRRIYHILTAHEVSRWFDRI